MADSIILVFVTAIVTCIFVFVLQIAIMKFKKTESHKEIISIIFFMFNICGLLGFTIVSVFMAFKLDTDGFYGSIAYVLVIVGICCLVMAIISRLLHEPVTKSLYNRADTKNQ